MKKSKQQVICRSHRASLTSACDPFCLFSPNLDISADISTFTFTIKSLTRSWAGLTGNSSWVIKEDFAWRIEYKRSQLNMIYGRHNQHLGWGAWIREHILDAHVQRGGEMKPRGVRGLGLAARCVTDGLVCLRACCSSPLAVGDGDMRTCAHVPFPPYGHPRKAFVSLDLNSYQVLQGRVEGGTTDLRTITGGNFETCFYSCKSFVSV